MEFSVVGCCNQIIRPAGGVKPWTLMPASFITGESPPLFRQVTPTHALHFGNRR